MSILLSVKAGRSFCMAGYTCRAFLIRVAAVASCICVALCLLCMRFSPIGNLTLAYAGENLREQNRSYCLYSPSSWAEEKNTLSFWELPFVQGEKVSYLCQDRAAAIAFATALFRQYDCYDVWKETTDNVVCYYASSHKLNRQVCVDGHKVNLHVAVDGNVLVVGAPMIFGGY